MAVATGHAGRTGIDLSYSRALFAGVLAGAIAGLLTCLLSVPLRRLAGVTDRAVINGLTVVGGAVALWALLGLLYAWLARRSVQPDLGTVAVAVLIAAVALSTVLADTGPLSPYPTRLASLAVPLTLISVATGAAALFYLVRTDLPLRPAAPGGLAVAAVAAVVVAFGDKQPAVHYTLSKLPARAAPAAGAPVSGAVATPGGPAAAPSAAAASTAATAVPAVAPGQTLHFVVAKPTEASYTVREKLTRLPSPSDAVGKTSAVTGDLYLTTAGLAPQPPSTFTVDMATLKSDAPARDANIRGQTLQVKQYPTATYTITGVDGFPASYKEGDQVKLTLHGTFNVHGVARPLDWTGTAQLSAGTLEAVMSTDFKMEDFNITPPDVSVAKSEDGVHLDLHLFATQAPG